MPQKPMQGYSVMPGFVVADEVRDRIERIAARARKLHPGRRVTKADVLREAIYRGLAILEMVAEHEEKQSASIEKRVVPRGTSAVQRKKQRR